MKFRFYLILTLALHSFAVAEDSFEKANAIWNKPLESEYQNIDFPYEAVIHVIECLSDNLESKDNEAEALKNSCIKTDLNRKALKGDEDSDQNAYFRSMWEGPPKEGPFTQVRVIRVGNTKSLLQIKSTKWSVIFGNSAVPELADKRLSEIQKMLANLENGAITNRWNADQKRTSDSEKNE